MKHRNLIFAFLAGILFTIIFVSAFDCGKHVVVQKEIDSSAYIAAKEEGKQEGWLAAKAEKDSVLKTLVTELKPVKKRHTEKRSELDTIKTEGSDSLSIIRNLIDYNLKCREVVLLADTVIKGMEMQLIVANSRMNIDDSLGKSFITERAELKNIIRLQGIQIRELSEESWFQKHKFELGFLFGAAAVTATVIALQ